MRMWRTGTAGLLKEMRKCQTQHLNGGLTFGKTFQIVKKKKGRERTTETTVQAPKDIGLPPFLSDKGNILVTIAGLGLNWWMIEAVNHLFQLGPTFFSLYISYYFTPYFRFFSLIFYVLCYTCQ